MATVRALRAHGGAGRGLSGRALDAALAAPDPAAVRRGGENLRLQVENVLAFGVPVVVALNAHPGDAPEEVAAVREAALAAGARDAVVARPYAEGGAGAGELARAVREAAAGGPGGFRLLYPDDLPLPEKIEAVARRVYRADGVDLSRGAAAQLEDLAGLGHGRLPVCIAKTPFSLSHDPLLGPNPRGFRLPVREVRLHAGAGYVAAWTGETVLMPGLPERPAAEDVDVGPDGRIVGLR